MKRSIILISIVIITVSAAIIFISCEREQESGISASASESEIKKNQIKPEPQNKPEEVQTAERQMVSEIGEPEGRDFLLYSENLSEPVIPYDFKIGSLESPFADESDDAVVEICTKFLDSIKKGNLETELIHKDKRKFVERNITAGMNTILPDEYRLGTIITGENPAWANIRFFKQSGSAEGIVYMVKEGGWKIFDLHINFEDMLIPDKTEEEEYLWEAISVE